jgi:hypothetical protein
VLLSAQSQAPGFGAALSELYRIYWYPLYAYVRRRGHSSEEARDLTQGFFLHLLEHKTLARADRLKGKFRSFLLGSLQNYLSTEADRARCLKRGGGVKFVALDKQDAEDRYTDRAPVGTLRPQMNFLMRLSTGLEIQIHGSERRGKRVKGWRSSSCIVEPYWFWMVWSRSRIHPELPNSFREMEPLFRRRHSCPEARPGARSGSGVSQTRYRSDFKRTWVRLGERGRRDRLGARRGESLFFRERLSRGGRFNS